MIIALIVLAVLAAFCFGVGGFLFFAACSRGKEWDWLDEEAVSQTAYAKYYPYIMQSHQWLIDHHAQDIYMKSHDGLMLHAVWVPAENPRGTIILAHGYHSSMLTDFALVYEEYHKRGINLLVPHQRAHGESEGKFITFGVKESKDFLNWSRYHNAHLGTWPVIFSGLSMGAATTMYIADEAYPENTVGFIADCGFTSPKQIIGVVFKQVTHLPAWPFLWAADLFARYFAGFRLDEKDSTRSLAKCKLPIVLVHGLADDFVPSCMTQRSFDACASQKELLLVEGAGHGVSFLKAKEEYLALISAFLDRVLEDKQ